MNVPENAEAVIKTVVDAVEKGTPIAPEVSTTRRLRCRIAKGY